MSLLWFLTEPKIVVSPRYGTADDKDPGATITVVLQGSAEAISDFFHKSLEPNLNDVIDELEVLVAAQLERTNVLLRASGAATADMIS
jgi:hypothetical protein